MAKMSPKEIADYRTLLLKRCADLRQEKHRVADALKRVAAELRDLERPEQSVFTSHSATDVPTTLRRSHRQADATREAARNVASGGKSTAIAKHYGGIVSDD